MEKRKAFTAVFRREAVRLSYDSCLTVEAVANDPNEDEMTRLRRAVKILRQERDILKKATAFFAKQGSQ